MENKRIENIDIAKGIAICRMVFGHACSNNNGGVVIRWIYSFHMPLFFISTGVLYGIRNKVAYRVNIRHKVINIMYPYLVWSTLYRLFVSILQIMGGSQAIRTIYTNFKNIVILGGSSMWFLPAMLCAYLVFHVLCYIFRQNMMSAFIGIIIMIITLILSDNINGFLMMFLARSAIGVGFIFIGFILKNIYIANVSGKILIPIFLINTYITLTGETVSIAHLNFGNPFRYIFMGCIWTLIIYNWSNIIANNFKVKKILSLWGENSLKILCLHGFVIQVIRLLDFKIFDNFLPKLGVGEPFVFTIIIMLVLTVVLKMNLNIINKLF